MENASKALEMAFAVMVFVMALTLAISTFSLARETADMVLASADATKYYEYTEAASSDSGNRIVGIDTIISNLYKYNKENNRIVFLDSSGANLTLYTTNANVTEKDINYFDLNDEISRNEKWTISNDAITENLAAFVTGNNNNMGTNANFRTSLKNYKNRQFEESIQKDTTHPTGGNSTTTKMIITYRLI